MRGMSDSTTPIEVFCSYAHEDESHLQKLNVHLSLLKREGRIATWHDRQIIPGTDWAKTIDTHLEHASVILLLVSPDFLASDYCYEIEMQRALQRHEANEARVVPIIVRPCDWSHALFAKLACLPRDGKAITTWDNEDLAWNDVTDGIRRVVEDLPQFSASAPRTSLPSAWNIPYPRNPVFTGRENILTQLAATLKTGKATALSQPQAISGLGGIGKTQIAVEYAYQHHQDYQAVLWTLADTRESLISGYMSIAGVLNLPEKDEQDQAIIIKAVIRWLTTHTQWLLILDNADDLAIAREFIPPVYGGHLLLTTRAQAMGRLVSRLEVENMPQDIGALFLLRRASIIAPDALLAGTDTTDATTAGVICAELGGLPLALDQAGAYIEETRCGLSQYLQRYRTHRDVLLKRRGGLIVDHPEPVATTWSLSFEKVEQARPDAADLLRLCTFLAPDAIPEELITKGAAYLGPLLQPIGEDALLLDEAIAALGAYSLIRRDASTSTMSIHRLVQAVLRAAMDASTQKIWIERAVRAVQATLPPVEHSQWNDWERLVAHVLVCIEWIMQEHVSFREAITLVQQTGWYLMERARYHEAASLLEYAYQRSLQEQGENHLDTARDASTLATLYYEQGKYAEAEPLYVRALAIREQQLGAMHPDTARSLNNLAALYDTQGKYAEAEPLLVRALAIREQQLGAMHPDTALSLNNLAALYDTQGKSAKAEPLYVRALAIFENILGRNHPNTQTVRANYSSLLKATGHQAEAEQLEAEQ